MRFRPEILVSAVLVLCRSTPPDAREPQCHHTAIPVNKILDWDCWYLVQCSRLGTKDVLEKTYQRGRCDFQFPKIVDGLTLVRGAQFQSRRMQPQSISH